MCPRTVPTTGCGRTVASIEGLEVLAFGVARRVVGHCRQRQVGCQVLVAVNEEAAALITGTQVGSTLLQAGSIRTFAGEQRFVAAVVEVEQDGACVPGRAPQLACAVLTQTAVGDRTVAQPRFRAIEIIA